MRLKFVILVLVYGFVLACGGSSSRVSQNGNGISVDNTSGGIGNAISLSTSLGSPITVLTAEDQIMILHVGQNLPLSLGETDTFNLSNGLDVDSLFD